MKLTCIMCPLGCEINVQAQKDNNFKITGNSCVRGENYAKNEMTNPMRSISSLVRVGDRVVPVKTSGLVPKSQIQNVLGEIGKIHLKKSPKIGTVIIKNVLGLGVDVISIGY